MKKRNAYNPEYFLGLLDIKKIILKEYNKNITTSKIREIIKHLNLQLVSKGKLVTNGHVSKKYFYENLNYVETLIKNI